MITEMHVSWPEIGAGSRVDKDGSTDPRDCLCPNLDHGHGCIVLSERSPLLGRSRAACFPGMSQVLGDRDSRTREHGTDGQQSDLRGSLDRLRVPTTSDELPHGGSGSDENDRSRRHLSSLAKSNRSRSFALTQKTVPLSFALGDGVNLSGDFVRNAFCSNRVHGSHVGNLPVNISPSQYKA